MDDLLLTDAGDILIESNDFVIGDSTIQNQRLLLISNKGDFKESPTVGVGIDLWLKDDDPDGLLAEVKKEFERDGMTVMDLNLSKDGKLDIDAGY